MYPSSIDTTRVLRVKVKRYKYGAQLTQGCPTHKVNGTKQWLNQVETSLEHIEQHMNDSKVQTQEHNIDNNMYRIILHLDQKSNQSENYNDS